MRKLSFIFVLALLALAACHPKESPNGQAERTDSLNQENETSLEIKPPNYITIEKSISVANYFAFMDSLVTEYQDGLPAPFGEHLIARANPWLIDTLAHTDYYYLKAKGIFNYDQRSLIVLKKGDQLIIPDSIQVDSLVKLFAETVLDINIPAFEMRVLAEEQTLDTFLIRVGRDQRKYLAMAGRNVDLRTRTGVGRIVRISRNPTYINPSNNHVYEQTRRDDGKLTLLPLIPWLEPELDGQRHGQLIHPTTNPNTLGKAYSNGCIGTREGDAWRIHYYAPLGTRIVLRYDLMEVDGKGDTILLKNIYPGFEKRDKIDLPLPTIAAAIGSLLDKEVVNHPKCIDDSLWWK